MKRVITFVITLVGALAVCASSGALAEDFTLRPGRWEVTVEMRFPGPMPQGMPGTEPMKAIDCVTEKVTIQKVLVQMPDDSCKTSNYREDGNAIQFTLKCDDVAVDYRLVRHSDDSFSATGISHGKDPTQRITFSSNAKRTGDACSAKELAESKADED